MIFDAKLIRNANPPTIILIQVLKAHQGFQVPAVHEVAVAE